MEWSIRLAGIGDAAAILAIYSPIVAETAVSFEIEPPSIEEMRRRIETTMLTHPWLVCEQNGVIGYAYAGVFRTRPAYQWTAEVTVYVHPDHHRRGVANALYTALFECLRIQGYRTAVAGIALPNTASVALHQRLGFRSIGVFHHVGHKLSRWHDVAWWEHALQDYSSPPPAPLPLPVVVNTRAWRSVFKLD